MKRLFAPITVGRYDLSHRVVMAPLTRMRSDVGDVPSQLMVDYYSQRASAGGFLISEATPVSLRGYGYAGAPGIYDDSQIKGWRRVTDAVHAKGGRIFLQLWHVGRQSHPALQPNGDSPVAPSSIQAEGDAYSATGPVPFSLPRALKIEEIAPIVEEFRQGAERALAAGFDGVEIHGANGYLPEGQTSAMTPTVVRSRIAPASCWKSPKQPCPCSEGIAWASASRRAASMALCLTVILMPPSATWPAH